MAEPTSLPSLGERILALRLSRIPNMTQEALANRAGVSVSLVRKLEQGQRHSAQITSLHRIAEALDVDMAALLGKPSRINDGVGDADAGVEAEGDRGIVAIREALITPSDDGAVADLDALNRQSTYAWDAFVHSKYEDLGRLLPGLIAAIRATIRENPGAEACAIASEVYHTAATMLALLGYVDLGYIAMERAIDFADQAGDPLRRTVASGRMSWLLLHHTGGAEMAMRLAVSEADQVEPRHNRAPAAEIAAWGGLLIDAAVAAARAGQPAEAADLLNQAETAATDLQATTHGRGAATGYYGRPVFGAALVVMQQVDTAVVTGQHGQALKIAGRMPPVAAPEANLPLDWKSRHLADIAAAQMNTRKDQEATETLLAIERLSPDWIRYQGYPRAIVAELLGRELRARTPLLRGLAERLGVVA